MKGGPFRIVVFKNGTEHNGTLIQVESDSMEVLLTQIRTFSETQKWKGSDSRRLFSLYGTEILKVDQLRDGDVVYVSRGEGFLQPGNIKGDSDQELVKLQFCDKILYGSKETLKTSFPESVSFKFWKNNSIQTVTHILNFGSDVDVFHPSNKTDDKVNCSSYSLKSDALNRLPIEMLEKIFQNINTEDALQSRLVCHRWHEILTPLCRSRHVALRRISSEHSEQNYVLRLFEKSRTIPWSSTEIDDSRDSAMFQKNLLQLFGSDLLKLKVSGSFDLILQTLRMAPNISHLKIGFGKDVLARPVQKFKNFHHLPLALRNLQQMEIELIEDSVVDFADFLLSNSNFPALKFFKTKLNLSTEEAGTKAGKLLAKIQKLALEIQFAPSTALAVKRFVSSLSNLRAKELQLHLEEPPAGNPHQLVPVERLLHSCAETLETLNINCTSDVFCGLSQINFKIPELQKVKSLQFTYIYHGMEYMHTLFLANFFGNLTSNHFPVLKKVSIQESCHIRRFGLSSAIFSTCKGVTFATVEELKVNVGSLPEDCWSRIFPNIRKLVAVVCESDLTIIFKNLKSLTHLSLEIDNSSSGNSVDWILSGISHPELIYTLISPGQRLTVNQVQNFKLKSSNTSPSLDCLRGLKILDLKFCWAALTDAGAYLTFMTLKPLQKFSLSNTKISDECEEVLRSRHPNFQRS